MNRSTGTRLSQLTGNPYQPPGRPQVGHIHFLNCLPLFYGLVRNHCLLDIDLFRGIPADLNRMLHAGELDVSAISSIEYLRHHQDLLLLPDITISSDGAVKSITLVSKVPLAELDGQAVALTSTSATSHVLTRIILEQRYGVQPTYFTCRPELDRMLAEADAALLIGDPALAVQQFDADGLHVYDLGQEWKEYTGQVMVFAVWAVRREFAHEKPDLVEEIHRGFQLSLKYSLEEVDQIAREAARWEPFSVEVLADYFRTLRYEFGTKYQEGLLEFARRAMQLGEIAEVPVLSFAQVEGGPQGQGGKSHGR